MVGLGGVRGGAVGRGGDTAADDEDDTDCRAAYARLQYRYLLRVVSAAV